MAGRKLDAYTLRHVARVLRGHARRSRNERQLTDDIMDREYWSGSVASYAGTAVDLLNEARALETEAKKGKARRG